MKWLSKLGLSNFKGKRILDLGCGSGYICQLALANGADKAVGIDIIDPKIQQSPDSWQFYNIDLDERDWHGHLKDHYDLIIAFDIIEHLSSPFHFLLSCQKLLNPKGKLFLTTPNTNSWERVIYPSSWSGAKDPQHKILFSSYSLTFLLQKSGYRPVSIKAPIRALSFLGDAGPSFGGQLVALAEKSNP